MGISFSTPYYLSGKQARSWHTNKGEKAGMTAAGLGAIGYGLSKPKYQSVAGDILRTQKGINIHPATFNEASKVAYVGAGVVGAYGAYHFGRAAIKNKNLRNRKNGNGKKVEAAFHSSRQAHGNID